MSKGVELQEENTGSEGGHAALEKETGRGYSPGAALFHLSPAPLSLLIFPSPKSNFQA